MDLDNKKSWKTGDHVYNNRDDFIKTSIPEYAEYRARFNDVLPAPVKSQAHMILTEVEQQLDEHETKYDSMRKRLIAMTNFYQNCATNSGEYELSDSLQVTNVPSIRKIVDSPRETVPDSSFVDKENSNDHFASGDTRYYDFTTETQNLQHRLQDSRENPNLSARSYRLPPREKNTVLDIQDENSSDSDAQNCIFEEARSSSDKNFHDAEQSENAVADDNFKIRREMGITDLSSPLQHSYQHHLAEYSKDLQIEFDNNISARNKTNDSSFLIDREIDRSDNLDSAAPTREIKKQELFLNLTASAESMPAETSIKNFITEKNREVQSVVATPKKKSAVKEVYESIGNTRKMLKKKKRRVKTSSSRSTTATRDANSIHETNKDSRKSKQKGHATKPASQSSSRRHEIETKIQQSCGEMVEIFYNTAAVRSGSISVVSSKHSKILEPRSRNSVKAKTGNQKLSIKCNRKLAKKSSKTKLNNRDGAAISDERRFAKQRKKIGKKVDVEDNNNNNNNNNRDQARINEEAILDVGLDFRSGEPNGTEIIFPSECSKVKTEDHKIMEKQIEYHHRCSPPRRQSPNRFSAFYDPFSVRNYELPTVASKMKRVNRSYFNRFNFRNIPFVVGTSVTPSYNLGLNIQEALSLMKTKQLMPGGATPFLISRVSNGIRPCTALLGCVKNREEIMAEETNACFDVTSAALCNFNPEKINTGNNNNNNATTIGEESTAKKRKTQSICSAMKFNSRKNVEGNPQLTQSFLLKQRQEELNIGDSQSIKWPNMPRGSKGIREVLVNFHDQFEAMQIKYEKLQEQAEKSSDKTLSKEIAALERELSAKEDEINAVVSLYQEVMALKQQMRILNERNSLVCVATECPGISMRPEIMARAHTANPPAHMINLCGRNNGSSNNRGPSTSTRLAGLLRQIKTFQKQLKSSA